MKKRMWNSGEEVVSNIGEYDEEEMRKKSSNFELCQWEKNGRGHQTVRRITFTINTTCAQVDRWSSTLHRIPKLQCDVKEKKNVFSFALFPFPMAVYQNCGCDTSVSARTLCKVIGYVVGYLWVRCCAGEILVKCWYHRVDASTLVEQ